MLMIFATFMYDDIATNHDMQVLQNDVFRLRLHNELLLCTHNYNTYIANHVTQAGFS